MFMCKRCHDRNEKHDFGDHLCSSFGPCEVCRRQGMCVDCKAHKKRASARWTHDVARPR